VEFIILVVLIPFFFNLGLIVGCGYLFAILMAVYRGLFFKKKMIARSIVVGSVLSYIAGLILFYGFQQEGWITFGLIILFGIWIWWRGFRLKKGKGQFL